MRVFTAAVLACLLSTAAARADESITVWLKNGGIVRGELVELTPNEHVTVKLATGEVRRIDWADVDHDSLGAKKSDAPTKAKEAEPAAMDDDAAHKPNAKAKAVADYVPPDLSDKTGQGALAVTGGEGYFLQRLEGTFGGTGYVSGGRVTVVGEAWKTECVLPCGQSVTPGSYRVDGDGIPPSSTFTLRGNERLEVSPGNSAGYYLGRSLFWGGAFALVLGTIMYASGGGDREETSGITKTLLIGGGGVVLGLPLWLLSRTTVEVKGPGSLSLRANGLVF